MPKHPAADAPPDEQAIGDMAPRVKRRKLPETFSSAVAHRPPIIAMALAQGGGVLDRSAEKNLPAHRIGEGELPAPASSGSVGDPPGPVGDGGASAVVPNLGKTTGIDLVKAAFANKDASEQSKIGTFEKFLGSLPFAHREIMTESYCHYVSCQVEFNHQKKTAANHDPLLTKARQSRIKGVQKQQRKTDRIQLARKYLSWVAAREAPGAVADRKAPGRLATKIASPKNKAEFIRRFCLPDKATADNKTICNHRNGLNRGLGYLRLETAGQEDRSTPQHSSSVPAFWAVHAAPVQRNVHRIIC